MKAFFVKLKLNVNELNLTPILRIPQYEYYFLILFPKIHDYPRTKILYSGTIFELLKFIVLLNL